MGTIRKLIHFPEKEMKIVAEESKKRNNNFTATLLVIVREWDEMKQERENNKSQADHA